MLCWAIIFLLGHGIRGCPTSGRFCCSQYLLGAALQDEQLPHGQGLVDTVQDVLQGLPALCSLRFRKALEKTSPEVVRAARPGVLHPHTGWHPAPCGTVLPAAWCWCPSSPPSQTVYEAML